MRAVDIIRTKRDGGTLSAAEIGEFVSAAAKSSWPDYQLSALLMAIYLRGMNAEETAKLTRAMADSGKVYDLSDIPGVKVDKHSTGGVGDKTSLILAPLVAACGAVVPMMSGRGLGHTGGTLDKLEAIPGFRVQLDEDEFRRTLKTVGMAMIGQTADVAPADKKLYSLRDVTSTVESIPLITASILSKKLAEGISGLVMDVKCGVGAFMKTLPEARALAKSIVRVGTDNGLSVEAVITNMEAPLGLAVGNSLEVIECVETLRGRGPKDLETLSVLLAAKMLRLAGKATTDADAEKQIGQALTSGAALERFRELISLQGGDPRIVDDETLLPGAPDRAVVVAKQSGYLSAMHAEKVGVAAMHLGAGRTRAEDSVDHGVGVMLKKKVGDAVQKGEAIFELHHRRERGLPAAMQLLEDSVTISDTPVSATPLVIEVITPNQLATET